MRIIDEKSDKIYIVQNTIYLFINLITNELTLFIQFVYMIISFRCGFSRRSRFVWWNFELLL